MLTFAASAQNAAPVIKMPDIRPQPSDAPRGSIDVWFTPGDNAEAKIIAALGQARAGVLVQAYVFTSRKLARALTQARKRGVTVQIIFDGQQLESGGVPVAAELAAAGIELYVDGSHAAAHSKILLIDAAAATPVVVTGSYNFTFAAQNHNAENLLIIRGDKRLAAAYAANWANHRAHAIRLQ